jgi:three-Cys-motif partner protein
MPVQGEHYWRDENGLWVENVGPWAKEKLKILTDYIQISSGTRKKYTHCAFVDVFSGPGKSKIRGTSELIDGSPVAAYKQAQKSKAFSAICISDADPELLDSATSRLRDLGAPVSPIKGPASRSLPEIVRSLSPSGLHLALLDPHNLGTLSFDLFECLAKLQRIDVIVHVSLGDLQRNVDRYTSADHAQFDRFAPGWRDHVGTDMNQVSLRAAILEYWTDKVVALGLPRAKHCELIRGTKNQRLYWLMFLAKHELPHAFWRKITSLAKSPQLDL